MEAIEVEVQNNKRDGRGRQLRSAEEWAQLAAIYRERGLTQKAFAQREGLKYATFVAWLGRPAAQGCGGGGGEPGAPFVRNAALGRDVASGGIVGGGAAGRHAVAW
ncbi:MAG: hypothetical protein J6386_14775 [Candidatus Synoicihabitans palmerolidicus]|nr:hypothetical protein [Candidatus Synoicihabitans palmerolidicus]